MKYASVCSGGEAWGPLAEELGYEPVFHAEIEPHASAVLRYRYPNVPNYGDFTQIALPDGPQPTQPIRLLCGGTPCQTYSVAGLREGLDSYKGGLTLEFIKLAQRLGVQWLLWENVVGVLSSDGGRAFGTFLGTLAECGYGFAYRVLDLQNWGVPQRRKRVFLVAYLGDWRPAAAVLFERESLSGNLAKGGKKREGTTQALTRSLGAGGMDDNRAQGGFIVPAITTRPYADNEAQESKLVVTSGVAAYGGGNTTGEIKVATTLTHHGTRQDFDSETFLVQPATPINTQLGLRGPDSANSSREGVGVGKPGDPAFTLQANHGHGVQFGSAVRRLVPTECEALMGWERNWTQYGINAKGKEYELADGPRYRICGNGWGAPVVAWILKRMKMIDELVQQ